MARRLELPPSAPRPGGLYEVDAQVPRSPMSCNRSLDYKRYNLTPVPGADNSKSMLSVPIVVGDRFLGDISIENFERENAFAPPDIRLVSTVADRVGAALENARLFDETQRLLKETEQRAAELAVINSDPAGRSPPSSTSRRSSISSATSCARCSVPATSASAGNDEKTNLQSLPVRLRARQAAETPRHGARRRAARSDDAADAPAAGSEHARPSMLRCPAAPVPGTDASKSHGRGAHRQRRPRARHDRDRELRARERIRRGRAAAADDDRRDAWAPRSRTRGSSTRRSGC